MKAKTSRKLKKSTTSKKEASGLYQATSGTTRQRLVQPVYYSVSDTKVAQTAADRNEQTRLARYNFTTIPELGEAIIQKASWVVGPNSFRAIHTGADEEWGNLAETWFNEQFAPFCSRLGPNYPLTSILRLTSMAIDIDGDSPLLLTSTTTGFPQVDLLPSHRIGSRNNEKIVKDGPYKDYAINDGVVTNANGRPIAYLILGDAKDGSEDNYVSANDLHLAFEPEWCDQDRGISRIARSLMDWSNQNDVNDFIMRGVKLATAIGLKHKTESGDGNGSSFDPGASEDLATAAAQSGVTMTPMNGGEIYFLKAGVGEEIETLKNENPSPNTEAFLERIQKRAMFSIGWRQEMLDPSKIGGASVRLVQDLTRKTVASRQETIERRAKLICNYAIAKAIKLGILPPNKEWFKWTFTKGAQVTVDNGNEAKADIENYKIGITTLSNICSKSGQDWQETRNQNKKEVANLIKLAMELSTETGKPYEHCLTLLQQNTKSQNPVDSITPEDTTQK